MNETVDNVSAMLLAVTRSLVDRPQEVRIRSVAMGETVTFSVETHPEEMGKLIGSNGRMARALRVILQANAVRLKRQLILDLGSPQDTARAAMPRTVVQPIAD